MNINMISAFQQAIYENNEGTKCVRLCQYDSAIKSFTSVLHKLKPIAVIIDDKHTEHLHSKRGFYDHNDNGTDTAVLLKIKFTSRSNDTEDDNATRATPLSIVKETDTSSSTSTSTSSTPAVFAATRTRTRTRRLKHFLFRDPIVISPESMIPSSVSSTSSSLSPVLFVSKFLMIVMYNLALTLHLSAISLVASSSSSTTSTTSNNKNKHEQIKTLFLRSQELYKLVLEIHLKDSDNGVGVVVAVDYDDDVDTLFTLAIANNLGLIYRTMKDEVRSKVCFETMFSVMMMCLINSTSHNTEELSAPTQSILIKDKRIWKYLNGRKRKRMNQTHFL